MKTTLLLTLVATLTLACHESPTEPGTPISFTTVAKEQSSGIKTPREEVITTRERWNAAWAEIVSNRLPQPPAPSVDFTSRAVVLVARGELGDACKSIETQSIQVQSGTFDVRVNEVRSPMSCVCPPVTVQPIHAVEVARVASSAAAHYQAVTVGNPCNQ